MHGDKLSEEHVKEVGVQAKERAKRAQKRASISSRGPIPAEKAGEKRVGKFSQRWAKTVRGVGDLTEAEQRCAVQQALEVFETLPPQSSYARHRIQVLRQVLELLDKAT